MMKIALIGLIPLGLIPTSLGVGVQVLAIAFFDQKAIAFTLGAKNNEPTVC